MSAGRIPTTANSPLTAKGDLFSFSTAPARLAVGSNGDTIVADSSQATGLKYQAPTVNTVIDAKGDILAGTAADTIARLAVGTNGQVLTCDSTQSTGLSYTTLSSGGMEVIATGSLSGTLVNITSIPATYKNLQLVVREYKYGSAGDTLAIRLNADSTASRYKSLGSNAAAETSGSFNGSKLLANGNPNSTTPRSLFVLDVYDYTNATSYKQLIGQGVNANRTDATLFDDVFMRGHYNQTGAITEINLLSDSGTSFSGGTYILYGVK